MNNYAWFGINRLGEQTQGMMNAHNRHEARALLRKQNIIARKISRRFHWSQRRIKPADITLFSRQITTLITAGIPLIQALTIIHQGEQNQALRLLVGVLKQDLETGLTFHEALKRHPTIFHTLFCNLVAAGEQSGTLDKMIHKIAMHNEQRLLNKQKIKQAMTYPLIVLVIATLITAGLLCWVVPQFETLYESMGARLPLPTRIVIYLSLWIKYYGIAVIIALTGLYYTITHGLKRSKKFTFFIDKWTLAIPIFGHLCRQAIIARFASTLSITFAAGLPLVDALLCVSNITGNALYIHATQEMSRDISNGHALHIALDKTGIFPQLMIQMIAIGEASGTLDRVLLHIASHYDDQVKHAIDTLNHLLEPLIMALLGLIIGGLLMAMYLPLLNIGSVI